ncbi:MAG: hypothetical protein ABI968_11060 [Acidobacteriota bacterium]
MEKSLRRWKCRDCSRANESAIALDGTGKCGHCGHSMNVQPSRLRNGVVLPATYPTRMGSPGRTAHVRSLGEV